MAVDFDEYKHFIRFPKKHLDLYHDGNINRTQLNILLFLYDLASPKSGRVLTNSKSLSDELKGDVSKNTVNKDLLHLRRQKLINFKNQQGRRGLFKIYIHGYRLMSNQFFDAFSSKKVEPSRSQNEPNNLPQSEDGTDISPAKQKYLERRKIGLKTISSSNTNSLGRSS